MQKTPQLNWWNDPRLANERRMVANITIILVVVLGVVGWIVFQVHRSISQSIPHQETSAKSDGQPPPAVTAAPAAPLEPAPERLTASVGLLENASLLLLRKDYEKCDEALALAELELMRLRGLLAFETGKPEVAEQFFEQISNHPGRVPNDLINLASVRLALDKKGEAIEAYESARSLAPDDDYAANRYYLGLLQVGEVARAEREINVALQTAPANALSQVALSAAVLHLERGQETKAMEFARAAKNLLDEKTFQALMEEPIVQNLSRRLVTVSSRE